MGTTIYISSETFCKLLATVLPGVVFAVVRCVLLA